MKNNFMRVGILTFHRAENFGAVLQCYALQRYLSNLGHQVEIVDYRNAFLEKGYRLIERRGDSIKNRAKNILYSLLSIKDRIRKKKKYLSFRKEFFCVSNNKYNDSSFSDKYDLLIVGSDQVWNTRLTGGYDPIFFLDFATKAKKISYAASSEKRDYPALDAFQQPIKKALASYCSISVRESAFSYYLNVLLGLKTEIVPDPTFLLDISVYKNMATPPCRKKGYVLVYNLVPSLDMVSIAQQYAKEKKLDFVVVNAGIKPFVTKYTVQNLGPLELLGYIIDAEYVFTTSFHGLAISLICEKQVYVYNKGPNERLLGLLKSVNLLNRVINESTAIIPDEDIDYESCRTFVKRYADNGVCYLKRL